MDWSSRFVLSWELDNTMEAGFCVSALREALERHGTPEISNTDQGSQFTSEAYLGVLRGAGVRISMDGRGRWIDNRFIERLWRSLKYEAVYLEELVGGHHARRVIAAWLDHYNHRRPHMAFNAPAEVYFGDSRDRPAPMPAAARSGRYAPCARGGGQARHGRGIDHSGKPKDHKLPTRAFIHQETLLALPSNCLNDPDHLTLAPAPCARIRS